MKTTNIHSHWNIMKLCHFIALLWIALPSVSVWAQDLFPDKALEAAVRAEVFAKRYNTEPLTVDDVKTISQVVGKGKGITNLEGLQHCGALMLIDLENNQIADLTPIKDLKLVQSLTLASNKIESIAPLENFTKLQYLDLSKNAVKDLAPVAKMTNMRSLYLSQNKIESLAPVAGLNKIWTLYVAENPITDFAPVSQLKWLSSLDVRACNISDLAFLKPLTELNYVMLAENKIADLGVVVEMAQADATGAKRFAPFWRLYLWGNPFSDAANQQQIPALKAAGSKVFTEKPQ
jgi:Leucine-rich repeat (LRR) protein